MVYFTWICRLDDKFRLVIPMKARESLNISDFDSVMLTLDNERLIIKKARGESGRRISKNHYEVL